MSDKIPQRIMDEAEKYANELDIEGKYALCSKFELKHMMRKAFIKGRMKSDGESVEIIDFILKSNLDLVTGKYSNGSFVWWSDKNNRSYTPSELYAIFLQSKQNK